MDVKERLSSLIEEVEELKKEMEEDWDTKNKLDGIIDSLEGLRVKNFMKEGFGLDINLFGRSGRGCFFEVENMPTSGVSVVHWQKNSRVNNSQKQPEVGRWLICFSFPTGAYVFGDEYIWELFNDFWEELKTYKYDFADEINHSLYFYLGNSEDIIENYHEIFSKYKSKYREYAIKIEKDRLEKRLKEIEDEE